MFFIIFLARKCVPSGHSINCSKRYSTKQYKVKLQLHGAIYRLRFYSNSLVRVLSLSNRDNNVASTQKNRGDKSHRVIVALGYNYTVRFIVPILLY